MTYRRIRRRGGILVSALVFVFLVSLILAGTATLTVSHYARANVESGYAAALYAAEAGVNYELRKISQNASAADQAGTGAVPGVSYALPGGSFTVYCANRNGATPWTSGQYLTVVSTGNVNGATRTVQVAARGFSPPGNYAVYTMNSSSSWTGNETIVGDVGTNGKLNFTGNASVKGSIYFNGPSAGWLSGKPFGSFNVVTEPTALQWETVDQKALDLFPASLYPPGGLAYIATHNNNASASPAISNNSISVTGNGSITLKGPGNYYLTSFKLTGNYAMTLDNTNGPINIWVGPDGSAGTFQCTGNMQMTTKSSSLANSCTVFVASTNGVTLTGNGVNATIYAYNLSLGAPYGTVTFTGNTTVNGQVIAYQFVNTGNLTVNYVQGLMLPTNSSYYGFDNAWAEENGAY